MLRSLNDLERYAVSASDGELGSVADFLLDDEHWVIRYLVVDTGGFLGGPAVLISPISFREADWMTRRFHLALTMDKIRNSPRAEADKPVSRPNEMDYCRYYGYPYYWVGSGLWGMGVYPGLLAGAELGPTPAEQGHRADNAVADVHLRSAGEVKGYHIQGTNDSIGHVEDFIVDDETWAVRFLVIDTRNWWPGKRVLVPPQWATRVSCAERNVYISRTREAIKSSPPFTGTDDLNRKYEGCSYANCEQPGSSDSLAETEDAHPVHHLTSGNT